MYSIDIKVFRGRNNLTQKQLAEYFGIGQGFISQMENGVDPIPDKYIRKILDDSNLDSSMVKVIDPDNEVKMPREVFDKMSQLIDTVCSQQETIAGQHRIIEILSSKKGNVHPDDNAGCADVG